MLVSLKALTLMVMLSSSPAPIVVADESFPQHIGRAVQSGISRGAYSGATIVIGNSTSTIWETGLGTTDWLTGMPVTPQSTIYDLASLTKVASTTLAAMYLYDNNRLDIYASAQQYLPAFKGKHKDKIIVRQLLTHTAGLPAGRFIPPSFSSVEGRDRILNTALRYQPGRTYLYSDLSAIILGMIVEEVTGMPLNQFVEDSIFSKIGLRNTFYVPADSLNYRIAHTDVNTGVVSDYTARRLGRVAGHAGLFGTASDLAIISQLMLNKGEIGGVRIFSEQTHALFTKRYVRDRALGWQMCNNNYGCGNMSSSAYGHTGYTGTSIWIDPAQNIFVVVLTNRLSSPTPRLAQRIVSTLRTEISNIASGISFKYLN